MSRILLGWSDTHQQTWHSLFAILEMIWPWSQSKSWDQQGRVLRNGKMFNRELSYFYFSIVESGSLACDSWNFFSRQVEYGCSCISRDVCSQRETDNVDLHCSKYNISIFLTSFWPIIVVCLLFCNFLVLHFVEENVPSRPRVDQRLGHFVLRRCTWGEN